MFGKVHTAFGKAHQMIWKRGYWKFLLAPILLSVALAVVLLLLCGLLSSLLSESIYGFANKLLSLPTWTKGVFTVLLFLAQLAPVYILFRSLVMVCYGPFLDRISTGVEAITNGKTSELSTSFIDSVKRPIQMVIFAVLGTVGVLALSFALGLIPLVGVILSGAFVLPANLFLSSIAYLDPYLERTGHSPLESLHVMWRNRFAVIYFGFIGFAITVIPIVGWFVGPTYSVVAGVVLAILLHKESQVPGR